MAKVSKTSYIKFLTVHCPQPKGWGNKERRKIYMNKLLTKIVGVVIGTSMAIGVGTAVVAKSNKTIDSQVMAGAGATYTITTSNLTGWTSSQNNQSGTSGNFTLTSAKNGNNGGGAATSGQIRLYKSGTFTISCSTGNMSKIVFACTASGTANYGPGNLSASGYSYNGSSGTWSGSSTSVTFTVDSTNQCRMTSIAITYDDGQAGQKLSAPSPVYDSANNRITWSAVSNASSYDLTVDGGSVVHNATSPHSLGALSSGAAHTVTVTAIGNGSTFLDSDAGSVTFALLTHAGTSADPYDVADARAALDDTTETLVLTDVYVRGIVTRLYGNNPSVTEDGELSYYISDDGQQSNELEAFKGKNLSNTDFTSTTDVQAGDVVVIRGGLTKYNTTYELSQGNYLISLERAAAKQLESIVITGSMTKTSYYTNEQWSPAGLIVTAYYDDESSDVVTDDVEWSYDYATPSVMGASASPQSLEITASYGGETDSATISVTVSAHSYTNSAGISEGSYYMYVMYSSTKYYFGGPNSPTANSYGKLSTNIADAVKLNFALVDDDVWNIDLSDSNSAYNGYHLALANNSTGLKYDNSSTTATNMSIVKAGTNFEDGFNIESEASGGRKFAVYTTGPQIRFYASGSYDFVMYLEEAKTISGFSVYSTGANKNVLKGTTFDAEYAASAGFRAQLDYEEGGYLDVTSLATWSLNTSVTNNNATLTVSYLEYTPVAITGMNVYVVVITSLTIDSSGAQTTYVDGDVLNTTGLSITGHDSSSNNYPIDIAHCTFSPANGATLTTSNTSVTVTYTNEDDSTATGSYSITVNSFVGYTKVTSTAGLVVGESYVIGVENTNKCFELMGNASSATQSAYRERVDGTAAFNSDKTRVSESAASTAGAVVFTLLSDGNGKYAFYDITNDKYLAGKTSTSSSNHLYNNDTLSDAGDTAWWTISFADGLMSVVLNGTENRVLGYNLSTPRFSTYTNYAANSTTVTSGTAHPVLFKMNGSSVKTSVTSFANTSLKMNDPAYEGDISTANCASNYAAMKEAYVNLSDAEKNVFQYSSDYANARARLNKWAAANHETFTYGEENPFAASRLPTIIKKENTTLISIIVIISTISLVTLGGYFLLRKRKEER